MRIGNRRDFFSGAGLAAIAAIMWQQIAPLSLIQGTSLGAGGLPKLSALALGLFGLYFLFKGIFTRGRKIGVIPVAGILTIAVAVATFVLGLDRLGIAIAGTFAAFLAGFAAPDRRLKELLIFSPLLSAACILLFVYLLGVPVPLWPSF